MKRKIVVTADGSTTIQLEDWNEHYHSKHGAIQEAYHVFIKNGLHNIPSSEISILEIGFGTGLNALITMIEAGKLNIDIEYVGVDAFPVNQEEINQLNFIAELDAGSYRDLFELMHITDWEKTTSITSNFRLKKHKSDFLNFDVAMNFDLIYFDAFGPRLQPELWTLEMFKKMYGLMNDNGILTTYSAKGSVRRAMLQAGFSVERLDGPPGKREMLRATKNAI